VEDPSYPYSSTKLFLLPLTLIIGLTTDTLISADIVLPDGTLKTITSADEDLFFAIKGGGNSLGVVYNFRLQTNPQSNQVYGGLQTYTFDQLDALVNATADFSTNNKDEKAQIIPTFNFLLGQPGLSLLYFYDGPTPPAGTFAAFDGLKTFTSGLKARSFVSLGFCFSSLEFSILPPYASFLKRRHSCTFSIDAHIPLSLSLL